MFLAIAGAVLAAAGQIGAGIQQRRAESYNAKVLEQQKQLSKQASEYETTQSHNQARRLKAEQETAYATSGAMIDSGTPLLVMIEQAGEMEKDILNQRRNRIIEQQGLQSQANMARYGGQQAQLPANIGAATTLLRTGAKLSMAKTTTTPNTSDTTGKN